MATIPTLAGFAAGENVTAAKLTAHTKTAIEAAIYYKPFAHIWASAGQTFATTGTTPPTASQLNVNTVVTDNDTMADTANFQLVVKTAGLYRITYGAAFNTESTAGSRGAQLYVNGSVVNGVAISAGTSFARLNGNWHQRLNVSDTLTVKGWQNSGVSVTTRTDYGGSFLMAEWISL